MSSTQTAPSPGAASLLAPRPAPERAVSLPWPAPISPRALDGVSVVIACRDDAATVTDAIHDAAWAASRISLDYEIVVVDHGSSDDTAKLAAAFTQSERLRLLVQVRPRGYGAAVRAGVAAARMPWIVLIDATGELRAGDLEDFLPHAAEHDLLTGWRILRRGPTAERVKGAAWSWAVGRVVGVRVRDAECALKLVRRDLIQGLDLRSEDDTIGAEIIGRALAAGGRVTDVGVHQREGAETRRLGGTSPRLGPRSAAALLRLRSDSGGAGDPPPDSGPRLWARAGAMAVSLVLAVVAGVGWLYLLRNAAILDLGPRLGGALPLQQLAGADSQPLLRLIVAWLPAGAAMGLASGTLAPGRRAALAAATTAALLTLAGAGSDAVVSSQPVLSQLVAQLGRPGSWAAVVLTAVAAALVRRRR